MTEDQIKHMVGRFLGWRLPENFAPDNGISFKQVIYGGMSPENQAAHWPVGTNLLDYSQAEAMVRYMVEGSPGGQSVPDDVARLVVAARIVAHEDQGPDALNELDQAAEAFASRVAWEGEPDHPSEGEAGT